MKNISAIVFCSVFVIFCNRVSAGFPKSIQKCKHGDTQCVTKIINYIAENKAHAGISELNLIPLDPLAIKSIDINQGNESPVNVHLKFKDSSFSGLHTFTLPRVKGFGRDLKGPHELFATGSYVTLAGPYDVKGRVLLLPISGTGDSNITLINPDFRARFHGIPYKKNGKTYMKVNDLKLEGKISRMHVYLGNLFNGDKSLGDNMNAFLNENWEDIFNEMKEKIFEAFGLIFQSVINNVFAKYSYDELFSD